MVFKDILCVQNKNEMIVHYVLYYYVITHNRHYAEYENTNKIAINGKTMYIYIYIYIYLSFQSIKKLNMDRTVQLKGSIVSCS